MARTERNGNGGRQTASEDAGWIERNRRPAIIAAVIAVLAFAAVVLFAYREGQRAMSAEPPLIRAPSGPLKVKPEDPGGMVVPDRDKLVYQRVEGEETATAVQLRPGPELPIKRPEPKPLKKPEGQAPAAQMPMPETAEVPVEVPAEPAAATSDTKEVTETAVVAPAPPASAASEAAPAPQTAGDGGIYIQLGALGERTAALDAWARLQKHFPVLAELNAVILPLTTGSGQTLHRLRAGPLADRAEAAKVCQTLQAQKQACFIVAP